jgi:hypothetical protein
MYFRSISTVLLPPGGPENVVSLNVATGTPISACW